MATQLIEVARAELDHLYKNVRPARYVILLCDKDGLVIEHRGEDSEAAQFRRWGIWLGGVWSEGAEGTNGIGTCLADGRPVTVHRSQHFRARHINLSCSGAPIFDGNGELLGVLDVSSIDPELSEHAHALTGALTIATARAIEERLFRKQFHREWIIAVGLTVVKGHNMQVPLDITFQNSEPAEAIRSEVEKQAKRLEKFHDRITSCHVTVIAPTMKRRHGDLFNIDICVAMPNHKALST
jgi:transcriptional regulator of acetoin/glycerol metabolism